jgi:hypothetical protein
MANKEGAQLDTLPSQQYGWNGSAPEKIATDGGAVVVRNLTADIKWDAIVPTFNTTNDVYVFSFDGSTTATITVSYTDATKEVLSGVTKVMA